MWVYLLITHEKGMFESSAYVTFLFSVEKQTSHNTHMEHYSFTDEWWAKCGERLL